MHQADGPVVRQTPKVDILVKNAASFPGAPVYATSKAAVESLTPTWAAELGPQGIRVNSIAPGPTNTEGVVAEWGDTSDELGRALALGRTAEPVEIAHAVLFLASPRASFICGSTLHADGGGAAI